jgi:hypothetical protein
MKLKVIVGLIVLVLFLGYVALIRMPYHFYYLALNEGIKSRYLDLDKFTEGYYSGGNYEILRTKEIRDKSSSEWDNLHFGEFIVPLPMEHPQFLLVPYFEKYNGEYLLGYRLVDAEQKELVKVLFMQPRNYRLELHHHKLFQMPIFKNDILKRDIHGVWKDLFARDLKNSKYLKGMASRAFPSNLNLLSMPIKEMVYDLFLLSVRGKTFPANVKAIQYWEDLDRGLLEVVDDETKQGRGKSFKQELLMVRDQSVIYPIMIRTKLAVSEAEAYRQRFFRTIKLKKSTKDSSIAIYSEYKNLTYDAKLEQSGFALLYAALSHERGSRAFLKEMIQFLERDQSERVILKPLYDYAYAIFGSSFSTQNNELKETAREKLFREMQEEETTEMNTMLNTKVEDMPESFNSSEDKVKRYLQEAKDAKKTKRRDMMIVD